MSYVVPGDLSALLNELAEPIPAVKRDQFLRRVRALLSADAIRTPAAIVAACKKAQGELLLAPPIDESPRRPSKPQPPRGPFRRRA
jgi:hypothetical protein